MEDQELCCICNENPADVTSSVTENFETQRNKMCRRCWAIIQEEGKKAGEAVVSKITEVPADPGEFLSGKFPEADKFIAEAVTPRLVPTINYVCPTSVFTPEQLRHRCSVCGVFLQDFLEQECDGCRLCIYNFASDIEEYITCIKNAKKIESPEKITEKQRRRSLRERIVELEVKMIKASEAEKWDDAINFRDEIEALKGELDGNSK